MPRRNKTGANNPNYKNGLGYINGKQTKLYQKWSKIKDRCNNSKSKDYKYYGYLGVKVFEEWSINFQSFYEWSLTNGYKNGLQIDRIDNKGNYEPSNCRWVTAEQNCQNRSTNVVTSEIVKTIRAQYESGLYSQKDLSILHNINANTILNIVRYQTWRNI